jgi:hypothetical protein
MASGDDGGILFRHKVTHDTSLGELVITPKLLLFIPSDNQQHSVQYTWSTIQATKYSPSNDPKNRVMLRVEMVANIPAVVFNFQGADLYAKKAELERLKGIIAEIRSSNSSSNGSGTNGDRAPATGAGNGQGAGTNGHHHNATSAISAEAKRKLLAADRSLAQQYQELVERDQIISDEEFWFAHSNIFPTLLSLSSSSLNSSNIERGKATSMIGDITDTIVNKNGKRTVNITPQQKEHIFAMYPAIKLAFEHEVGVEKTEPEFWIAFLQSEFYLRTFNASNRQQRHGQGQGQTDDMFSRYSMLAHNQQQQQQQQQKIQKGDTAPIKIPKLTGKVDLSVDLTSTTEDFHASENNYFGDVSKLTGSISGSGSAAGNTSGSVYKYNRHSEVIMGNQGNAGNKGLSDISQMSSNSDANHEIVDLQREETDPNHDMIPLILSHPFNTHSAAPSPSPSVSSSASVPADGAAALSITPAADESQQLDIGTVANPFGVSANAVRKSVQNSAFGSHGQSHQAAQTNGQGTSLITIQHGQKRKRLSASEIVSNITTILPSKDVALAYMKQDCKMIELSQLCASGTTHLLTADFQQEMLESFRSIGDLLRIVYAIMNREGSDRPSQGSASAQKLTKLFKILSEKEEHLIQKRKYFESKNKQGV